MKSDIVNNLKLLRQKTGMSQKELASKLGVSQNAVYNWENGK
ncbi:helix-turn-helix transcriptional regulator, partial [Adlercreutzia equolifaciens]